MSLDRRRTPARPDLAAAKLRGKVEAARYVEGESRRVALPATPLKREPRPDAPYETEALSGEPVTVYEEVEGWAWVQLETDGYVGWLSANALGSPDPAPTHRVAALRTFLYPGPSIKAEPLGFLSLGASVAVLRREGDFAATPLGFVHAPHLARLDAFEADYVEVAARFLCAPYLWGGKSSLGLDCSGLVQIALAAAGVAAPRDSDMQASELGEPLDCALADLRRGDLVFWKGHVGIVEGPDILLHANGHHMMVARESLEEAVERIAAKGQGGVTALRRPAPYR
jgi:cell wall-associated NlpC family hydrolase